MDRPDKTMYFLKIALSVAARSTCLRRKFGAVIVKDNTIVGTGYNGNARGVVNCSEVGCIKDLMNAPQGEAYDYCPAVHAEENAIINSNRADRIGATLYIAGLNRDGNYTMAVPCQRCQRKIINSQISEVVILRDDGTSMRIDVNEYVEADGEWYREMLRKARGRGGLDKFINQTNSRPTVMSVEQKFEDIEKEIQALIDKIDSIEETLEELGERLAEIEEKLEEQ